MRTVLKWLGIVLGGLIGLVFAVIFWGGMKFSRDHARTLAIPPVPLTRSVAKGNVAHGRHLVSVRMACVECHGADLSGGKMEDNFMVGAVYGPNLTPAALQDWTDADIARAIRSGVNREGHPLMIMPSQDYQYMSQEDLVDILAYLRSVPAVEKPRGPLRLGPLMKVLYVTGKFTNAFAVDLVEHGKPFPPAVKEVVSVKFGEYIVKNTCIGCHKPDLTGGKIEQGPPDWALAANLTQDALADWSEADFTRTIKTGVNPSGSTLKQPMAMIVKYTSKYSSTEIKAVWAYLKTVQGTADF